MPSSTPQQTPTPGDFFTLNLLYSIPIIGTIFLIKHATDPANPVRRNFARSKFIPFLIYGILIVAALIFGAIIYAANGWKFE